MGQQEQPGNSDNNESGKAQDNLRAIEVGLENLKKNLLSDLSGEIEQLQNKKKQLIEDIEQLESQHQQQTQQQQELAKQLAPAIAQQLHYLLQQRLQERETPQLIADSTPTTVPLSDYNENAYRLISSLDSTLRTTFKTLQQDLSSYQSTLSQQLGQMYSLEQQGEAILETLVNRLKDELKAEKQNNSTEAKLVSTNGSTYPAPPRQLPPQNDFTAPPPAFKDAQPLTKQPPPVKTKKLSLVWQGFILVVFASLILSLQNVIVSIILQQSSVFGRFDIGGYISPNFGNSLLILWLRMMVVVPLMFVLGTRLYPQTQQDISQAFKSQDRDLFLKMTGSGFFLFLSSALIYLALGFLSPGVALTIFFIFPMVTVLLSWLFFGEKPSIFRGVATVTVLFGVYLISSQGGGAAASLPLGGIFAAAGAGTCFSFSLLLAQASYKKIHPIPFTLVQFVTMLAFASLVFLLPLPGGWKHEVRPGMWDELWLSGLVLGVLTFFAYLANNIGIKYIGAARASIFGATGPALTAILALIIKGDRLESMEIWGMLIVSAGVLFLSLERFYNKKKKKKA